MLNIHSCSLSYPRSYLLDLSPLVDRIKFCSQLLIREFLLI